MIATWSSLRRDISSVPLTIVNSRPPQCRTFLLLLTEPLPLYGLSGSHPRSLSAARLSSMASTSRTLLVPITKQRKLPSPTPLFYSDLLHLWDWGASSVLWYSIDCYGVYDNHCSWLPLFWTQMSRTVRILIVIDHRPFVWLFIFLKFWLNVLTVNFNKSLLSLQHQTLSTDL